MLLRPKQVPRYSKYLSMTETFEIFNLSDQ